MTILIAVLLVVSSQLTITGMRSAGDRRATLQAQYAAESGLAIAKVRLRDTQAILNGVTNPDGTISPVLEIPRSTKAADLISMAEGYCGKTGSAAWTQTSAAGTYPVKYKCSAAAPAAGDNPNRYKVLSVFARMDRMPPGLAKGRNLKTNTDLQTYFSQAFSPTGITTTPAGGNYEVTYRLVPTRVERTGNTNFKFYMQVQGLQSTGKQGVSTRVLNARSTQQSEIWFQIALPSFVDRVLFTNHHTTKDDKRPNFTNQVFDGPVHTNDRFTFAVGATAQFKSKVTSAGCTAYKTDGTCATNTDGSLKTKPGLYVSETLNQLGSGGITNLAGLTNAVPSGVGFAPVNGVVTPDWQSEFQPMPENAEDQAAAANAGGLNIPNGATVTLAASTSGNSVVSPTSYSATDKKWTPAPTYQFITVKNGATITVYRVDAAGKMDIQSGSGWSSFRNPFNGVLYSNDGNASKTGNITISGPGRSTTGQPLPAIAGFSQLTIAAEDNVGIASDLTYSDVPCKAPDSCASKDTPTNLLGIYSQSGNVSILKSAPDDINIHSVLMAGEGEVNVESHDSNTVCTSYDRYGNCTASRGRGKVNLIGGLIENYYGAFGTFSPKNPSTTTSGYGRNFSFDERMGEGVGMSPPYFPLSPKWKIESPNSASVALTNLTWQQSAR
ncbi:DUF4900 domain-containing protein [Deinococcus sp. RM]|uniref:DUF4900 domain-containing protein n=1 Tax=Deinococcus sp. RM TaxID=2316359 RepID=UPI0013149A19|nr:DUF4900 domain-containing protein [Deinococcus sp. RM]